MTRINIPPAALEAGARAAMRAIIYDIEPDVRANGLTDEEHAIIARAAFEAMAAAWPGMSDRWFDSTRQCYVLILPLPQEGGDEQA